jgi:hypothetical protein
MNVKNFKFFIVQTIEELNVPEEPIVTRDPILYSY